MTSDVKYYLMKVSAFWSYTLDRRIPTQGKSVRFLMLVSMFADSTNDICCEVLLHEGVYCNCINTRFNVYLSLIEAG